MLPIGYSFNLDGSAMYCAFAMLFIAQIYKIELDWQQQGFMLLVLMVTSKGIAGKGRRSDQRGPALSRTAWPTRGGQVLPS